MKTNEKKRSLVNADRKLTKAEWDLVLFNETPKREKKYGRTYTRRAMK